MKHKSYKEISKKLAIIILASSAIIGCRQIFRDFSQPVDQTDAIRLAERQGKTLECGTAEPFTSLVFNMQNSGDGSAPVGNGKIEYSYPGPLNTQMEVVTRLPSSAPPFNHHTYFELTNGMKGTISKTTSGLCVNDMVTTGPPEGYVLFLESIGIGNMQSVPAQKYGCCQMR